MIVDYDVNWSEKLEKRTDEIMNDPKKLREIVVAAARMELLKEKRAEAVDKALKKQFGENYEGKGHITSF